MKCNNCNGIGTLLHNEYVYSAGCNLLIRKPCKKCNGTGNILKIKEVIKTMFKEIK